jgi:hypothetical protein
VVVLAVGLLIAAVAALAVCFVPQFGLRKRHPILTARLAGVSTALLILTIVALAVEAGR